MKYLILTLPLLALACAPANDPKSPSVAHCFAPDSDKAEKAVQTLLGNPPGEELSAESKQILTDLAVDEGRATVLCLTGELAKVNPKLAGLILKFLNAN